MTTLVADARRGHRGLFWFAVAMAVLVPVLAVLAVVDDRVLLGAPLWFKPLKFAVSFVAYAGTLAWLLGRLKERTMQRTGWVVVAASADRVRHLLVRRVGLVRLGEQRPLAGALLLAALAARGPDRQPRGDRGGHDRGDQHPRERAAGWRTGRHRWLGRRDR